MIAPLNIAETSPSFTNNDHKTFVKTRMISRKTYLSGFLQGKYWGEMVIHYPNQYEHDAFYEFHIYEAEVYINPSEKCRCISPLKPVCSGLHAEVEGKFHFDGGTIFPKERLPQLLPIVVKQDGNEYEVNIHEVQLADVIFIAALHQTNGKEVFGTIEAKITGYLLDFVEEEYTNSDFIEDIAIPKVNPAMNVSRPFQNIHNTEHSYYSTNKRYGYYRRYNNVVDNGCASSIIGIIVIVVWATFLITLLPQAAIILPFIIIPLLCRLIPLSIWGWFVNVISLIIALGFIIITINTFQNPSVNHPIPVVSDHTTSGQRNETFINDTIITHGLRWKDYDGNKYAGKVSIQRLALNSASQYKTSLSITINDLHSYDEMVYRLKEHDKDHLSGIYSLFDSIRSVQHLQDNKFAELIVSCVQQIPYAVVLPEDCNASLYSDQFIRNYLATPGARCDGNEKFGINTPVEFMANLKGDCDTRTLLLYTVLSHYKYGVVLLSSEYYNHSLIGINLQYDGVSFIQGSKRYVLWETTAVGIRPGILPDEISNLNYWRISLKSE